ncbi:M23 family metallopeptidase [Salinimicrobium sp. HB62]|uniref:M23 family metallopeptidase n=1 Tax=Salinimicrobium sp. HB62 TaxID=3077781 RepID=UPI002D787B7C|nr:M23 family metallopeptidase [Salinimicrobium sp. HB62]
MKKKKFLYFISFILAVILLPSCSGINKAKDLFIKPTAREQYERDFEKDPAAFAEWKMAFKNALFDSVAVSLPYAEAGRFTATNSEVYTYDLDLNPGERLLVEVESDSVKPLIFLDLYEQKKDSLSFFNHLLSAGLEEYKIQYEPEQPGTYKLLVQPEVGATSAFTLKIYTEPVYSFPVADRDDSAVQSFWGAARDGGRRSHEGIDIFAPRGTPVVAATEGRVSSTGNKGLGGKQVWLRDRKRGTSLYYAHLDSIIARPGMKVFPGDTLGLVGNTGNARTTPPHLHFGIYKGYRGAQNPFPYVRRTPVPKHLTLENTSEFLLATGAANLRKGPSTRSEIASKAKKNDTLRFLGETKDWYHARLRNENFFIHKSLADPI